MDEDLELNGLIRASLEAGGAFAVKPRRARLTVRRWVGPSLLAASLALVVAMRVTLETPADPVADAIALLLEADGGDLADCETSGSSQLLLAWQDSGSVEIPDEMWYNVQHECKDWQ